MTPKSQSYIKLKSRPNQCVFARLDLKYSTDDSRDMFLVAKVITRRIKRCKFYKLYGNNSSEEPMMTQLVEVKSSSKAAIAWSPAGRNTTSGSNPATCPMDCHSSVSNHGNYIYWYVSSFWQFISSFYLLPFPFDLHVVRLHDYLDREKNPANFNPYEGWLQRSIPILDSIDRSNTRMCSSGRSGWYAHVFQVAVSWT